MVDMKYEVSSSVSLFPSLSLTLTGGPVGLTAKLAPGNAYDGQIERLKQIKTSWVKGQDCFFFCGVFFFAKVGQSLYFLPHLLNPGIKEAEASIFLIPVYAPCAIIFLSHHVWLSLKFFCPVFLLFTA